MSIVTSQHATAPPRFGVEEEFFVVDAQTGAPAPRAAEVVDSAKAVLGPRVSGEITTLQLETRTDPCLTLAELGEQLSGARKVAADSAMALGLRLIASGTSVIASAVPPPMTTGPRQDQGTAAFRGLHDELAVCALHVHVEMPGRELALAVSNQLRPYLPVLLTLTANSPFWDNRDSGYASWRTMTWPRWPVAGPPPVFDSPSHYDQVVETALAAGALVDRGTIFWDVRPSDRHPTLEIRVADTAATATDAACYAAVVRALVVHLSTLVSEGHGTPRPGAELLRLAYWRAARDGLAGHGVDVLTGQLTPAAELAQRLVEEISPVLQAYGEHEAVREWLAGLLASGTGADRQRQAARDCGELPGVVTYLANQTLK
jgi:carboxylate-amine ligase